jgi:hypothetical protein
MSDVWTEGHVMTLEVLAKAELGSFAPAELKLFAGSSTGDPLSCRCFRNRVQRLGCSLRVNEALSRFGMLVPVGCANHVQGRAAPGCPSA